MPSLSRGTVLRSMSARGAADATQHLVVLLSRAIGDADPTLLVVARSRRGGCEAIRPGSGQRNGRWGRRRT